MSIHESDGRADIRDDGTAGGLDEATCSVLAKPQGTARPGRPASQPMATWVRPTDLMTRASAYAAGFSIRRLEALNRRTRQGITCGVAALIRLVVVNWRSDSSGASADAQEDVGARADAQDEVADKRSRSDQLAPAAAFGDTTASGGIGSGRGRAGEVGGRELR